MPHDVSPARLARMLGDTAGCQIDNSTRLLLTFFDSFDWRLHAAGLRLLQVATPLGTVLRLKDAVGSEVVDSIEIVDVPAWPADFPASDLQKKVAGLLEMRVLLPVARVQCEVTDLGVLNEDAKTVVRLQMLRLNCDSAEVSEPRTLWPRLRLVAVKGYEDELAALAARLADEWEWPSAPECLFDEAVAAVGREPGDYSSKLEVPLKPGTMAVDALRKVMRRLLDTLESNIAGARADLDSEFLHDLRVATRRTRSALSQVKHVLPDDVVADFRQRFAWLGQVTGPTRDLDVFLLELPRYRASLPTGMAGDLDVLANRLRTAQQAAQQKLRRELGAAPMRALLDEWRTVLEADELPGEPGWFADLPVERVAGQRIWRMYKKVLKDGRAVVTGGHAEDMHALRKDCKKLRYLIEFFRGLYPAPALKGIIRTLKDLLDNLGDFQDLEVQADTLRGFAREIAEGEGDSLPAVLAIGALVADLLRHQQAAHERFAGCFGAFDTADNHAQYKALFKNGDPQQG
ncbi:MAG: CHAD domain-containing protein [Gammaproteobacteria bacterium]|nr:CHAD domain-containing protein [Gammaproteobacteria bacterium]